MRQGLMAMVALALGTAPVMAEEMPVPLLDGMWQISDVLAVDETARQDLAQPGRLLRLGRQSLLALDGAACAGPTLRPLADMPQPAGVDVTPDMQRRIAMAVSSEPGARVAGGVAGYCLGAFFAVYVPQSDGSLLVADQMALYRLRPLAHEVSP